MSFTAVLTHPVQVLLSKFICGHSTVKADKTNVFWDRPFPIKLVKTKK